MDMIGYYLANPQAIIYMVANALLYPVLFVEVIALVWTMFEAGRFTVEVTRRGRHRSLQAVRAASARGYAALADDRPDDALHHVRQALQHGGLSRRFADGLETDDLVRTHLRKLVAETESEAARLLSRTRTLVRIGPMLGLMGTLIPISPALVGLAQGDVQTLADNLVIAFSTTVVGILIGGVSYLISAVRERLYRQDISDIEYVLETLEV